MNSVTEKSAVGVKGFVVYSPFTKERFFRVYGETDPVTGDKTFKDYRISTHEMEVEITDGSVSLYEGEGDVVGSGQNKLDWSSQVLGKKK